MRDAIRSITLLGEPTAIWCPTCKNVAERGNHTVILSYIKGGKFQYSYIGQKMNTPCCNAPIRAPLFFQNNEHTQTYADTLNRWFFRHHFLDVMSWLILVKAPRRIKNCIRGKYPPLQPQSFNKLLEDQAKAMLLDNPMNFTRLPYDDTFGNVHH